MIQLPETGAVLGRCGCGALVRTDSFRDLCAYREWFLSRCCSRCQDLVFLALDEEGNLPLRPLRFGVLAAALAQGRVAPEIALLPFLFVPELHVLAWEARYIVSLASPHSRASFLDLDPMTVSLNGHYVRVTEIDSHTDPRLGGWFSDLELLLAADLRAIDTILAACPALATGLQVSLADALDWSRFVPEVLPAHVLGAHAPPVASALHLCARMGAALVLPEEPSSDEPRTAAWHLLESLRPHFFDRSTERGS